MKLWLQSGSALTADDATPYGRLYEESMNRRLRASARPGVTVSVHGIDGTPHGKDRFHTAFHQVTTLMIKSALRAEAEGYDAVAVINTFDHGYYELREVLNLPVAFITESALHLACQLAPSFGFVTHNQSMLLHLRELTKRYGVADRLAGGAHLEMTYADFPKMYENPAPYLDAFAAAARQVIAQGAATLLVAGNPMNMFLLDQDVRDIDDVPILDYCAAVVKTAEMMVDLDQLGVKRARTGLFTAPPAEDQSKLRAMFE
ncbi:MAG: aspartate/glutamate racemase family protein [Alphaproteobacteria bacterium]|jgi:allantoin racemase